MGYIGNRPTAVPLTSADIQDGSVDSSELVDNSVTLAKMAGLARGKLIYGDASGDPAALAVGAADEVLTHDGTDFDWAAAGGGGGFTVLTSSYSSTDTTGGVLSFPSFVSATYDHYKVIGFCVPLTDNVDFWMRPYNASGHYSTSNQFYYEYLARYRSSSGGGAYDNGSWQDTKWKIADNVNRDSDSNFVAFNIDLYEWGTHNTSRLAFGGTSFHHQANDGMKTVNMGGSLHTDIDATGLDFLFSGGQIDKHGITIYGVNKS